MLEPELHNRVNPVHPSKRLVGRGHNGGGFSRAHFHHIHIVKHDAPPGLLLVVEHRQCNMHALVHVGRITPLDLERWLH